MPDRNRGWQRSGNYGEHIIPLLLVKEGSEIQAGSNWLNQIVRCVEDDLVQKRGSETI